MTDPRSHWDHTYTVKPDTEVSWYQPAPDRSLSLIKPAAPNPSASIIDVGGGASRLVDRLLKRYKKEFLSQPNRLSDFVRVTLG